MRTVARMAAFLGILALLGACSPSGPQGKGSPCPCAQQDGCHCPLSSQQAGNKPAAAPASNNAASTGSRETRQARGHGRQTARRERRLERWEAWVEKREGRTAHRESMMERREARHRGWRAHEREHFNDSVAALPYDYRSTSRHYTAHERFGRSTMHERFAMRSYWRGRGFAGRYSERDYGRGMSRGFGEGGSSGPPSGSERGYDRERGYGEEGVGRDDHEEGPEGDAYAGGYAAGGSMSINARASLDSWHGYGVDCPPSE